MLEMWLSSYLPRALDGTGAPARESVTVDDRVVRGRHACPGRGGRTSAARRAACMRRRCARAWMIVDNGSTDGTLEIAERLAAEHDWINVLSLPGTSAADRGAPIVQASRPAIAALDEEPPEIVVKVDADISMEPDYFERPGREVRRRPAARDRERQRFELQPRRAGNSGTSPARPSGARRVRIAGSASRRCSRSRSAWRWDGVDEFKANSRGWRHDGFRGVARFTTTAVRERGTARPGARAEPGQGGALPRLSAVVSRAPRALATRGASRLHSAMIWGYAAAALRRAERNADVEARAYLRRQQSPRNLRHRALEARGRREQPKPL